MAITITVLLVVRSKRQTRSDHSIKSVEVDKRGGIIPPIIEIYQKAIS